MQAVILGTTFLKVPDTTAAYFSRGGILFLYVPFHIYESASFDSANSAVFLPALFTMAEIPALFSQRRIIHRHQNAAMYHPMVEAIAMTLVDVPFTFVTIVLFTIIIYFVVRLQTSPGQYLCVQFNSTLVDLLLFMTALSSSSSLRYHCL